MENSLPGVLDRVKAVVVDTVFVILMMIAAKHLFSYFEYVNETIRIVVFVFIFILYDPLFTSLFGATIGHAANGICVKRANDPTRNIIFPLALIRFLAKYFVLGWISLITVGLNDDRKAIHDLLVGSMVFYR